MNSREVFYNEDTVKGFQELLFFKVVIGLAKYAF